MSLVGLLVGGAPEIPAPGRPAQGSRAAEARERHDAESMVRRLLEREGVGVATDPLAEEWRQIRAVEAVPGEPMTRAVSDVNAWQNLGPYGVRSTTAEFSSGRVTDIEVGAGGLRVAAASGGLWEWHLVGPIPVPVPLTDALPTQWVGSFATHPTHPDTIVVGTGEPHVHAGSGIWYTLNGGETWQAAACTPSAPTEVYRLRFAPDGNTVHATTRQGYYRSDDGGMTWTRHLAGDAGDFAIHPTFPDWLFMTQVGVGLMHSSTNGDSWSPVSSPDLPTTNIDRGAIAICAANPLRMYVQFARADDRKVLGVYRTSDGGLTWKDVAPADEYMWGQGWYNNAITVSPTDQDIVLVGGGSSYRSTKAGVGWEQYGPADPDVHVDAHAFAWDPAVKGKVYAGHDGGFSYSLDDGANGSSALNTFPSQQLYSISVGVSAPDTILGATQDNGTQRSGDGGTTWKYLDGGDAWGACVDPADGRQLLWTASNAGRYRSQDGGASNVEINTGIIPPSQLETNLRTDRFAPVQFYAFGGAYAYSSTDQGSTWIPLNLSPFPMQVRELTVSPRFAPGSVVYAHLASAAAGQGLRVYDGGAWLARGGGASLRIYDSSGRHVRTCFDGVLPAGSHQVTLDPSRLPSGVYFVALESAGQRVTRRWTIAR